MKHDLARQQKKAIMDLVKKVDQKEKWRNIRDTFLDIIYNERINAWKARESGLIVTADIYDINFVTKEWSKRE